MDIFYSKICAVFLNVYVRFINDLQLIYKNAIHLSCRMQKRRAVWKTLALFRAKT